MRAVSAAIAVLLLGIAAAPAGARTLAEPLPPAPSPSAAPLREIGHVRAMSAYCSAFERHFNGAARALLDHDAAIGKIDLTLTDVTNSFHEFAGDLKRHDERLRLAAWVDQVMRDIPAAQEEVNALRRAAALTSDPIQSKRTRALAAELQHGLDRQHQIITDAFGVADALLDLELSQPTSAAGYVLPWSDWLAIEGTPSAALDVKSYTRMHGLEDRVGDAETKAARIADTIVLDC